MRKYKSEGEELDEAISHSIDDLADDSPIKNYLLSMEVSMISKWLTAEYSVTRHEEYLREEGREEGREEERAEAAKRMIKNGKLSLAEIAEYVALSLEDVQKLVAGN